MSHDDSHREPPKSESDRTRRSPVERALVWGTIAVLALAAAYQAAGRFGYTRTLTAWNAALEAAEDADNPEPFTLSEAESLASGFHSKSLLEKKGQWHVKAYRWGSLWNRYEIVLKCLPGDDPQVILIDTGDEAQADAIIRPAGIAAQPEGDGPQTSPKRQSQPSREPTELAANSNAAASEADAPRQGPFAGYAGFIIGSSDQDGDGRLNPQEAPESIRPYFDRLDQNGDGFLDSQEVSTAPTLEELEQKHGVRPADESRNSEVEPATSRSS